MASLIKNYYGKLIDLEKPTLLYKKDDYEIYWLGIDNETAFRCNAYLIKSGNEVILIDPGSKSFFNKVKQRVSQVVDPLLVANIIISHQDPDIAASMVDWLDLNPNINIITSQRTNILITHYGKSNYNFYDIDKQNEYIFKNGNNLSFVTSPYLHSPGAFTTYDLTSKFLFSSDIWAALDIDWKLIVEDFNVHKEFMNLFHKDYMASNLAARGYIRKIEDLKINAILPQHGSIISKKHVLKALKYLKTLQCGTDIIYADIS